MMSRVGRCSAVLAIAVFLIAGLLLLLPAVSAAPSADTWIDDFDSTILNSRWSWVYEVPDHWSLTDHPGFMRITTTQDILGPNRLVQAIPDGAFRIETRVLFTPSQSFEVAGLGIYQDVDNFIALGRAYCDTCLPIPGCQGNAVYLLHAEQGAQIGDMKSVTTTAQGEAYLRLDRLGDDFFAYVSEDGANWTPIGKESIVSGMVPSLIGISAGAHGSGVDRPADFDYVQVDELPRVFLPLVSSGG